MFSLSNGCVACINLPWTLWNLGFNSEQTWQSEVVFLISAIENGKFLVLTKCDILVIPGWQSELCHSFKAFELIAVLNSWDCVSSFVIFSWTVYNIIFVTWKFNSPSHNFVIFSFWRITIVHKCNWTLICYHGK